MASVPPAPVHSPGASSEERYIDWFMWARSQPLSEIRCHGAAHAAVKAERSGADPVQAAIRGADLPESEIDPSQRMVELCNWYAWAVEDQKLAAR